MTSTRSIVPEDRATVASPARGRSSPVGEAGSNPLSPRLGYLLAALMLAASIGFRAAFDGLLGNELAYTPLMPAVVLIVWLVGMWPAICGSIAGFLACHYLFVPPRHTWVFEPLDWYSFIVYGIATALTIVIGEKMRQARADSVESARIALDRQREAERVLRERDQAEAEARELNERLRVAVKSSRFELSQVDAELRYRWVHNPHRDFPPAVLGRRDDEIDDSPAARRLVELKRHVLDTGRSVEADLTMRRGDAERTYCFTLEPLLDAKAAVIGVTSAAVDITDRRRNEEALRENEEMFRALAENVPQLAWMARADGSMFWFNRRWFDYTGTRLADVCGWAWKDFTHPDHMDRITSGFRNAVAKGRPWEDTFPLRAADGRYRWFLTRAFPINDTEGKISRWFGTSTDITVLRDTQEALRDAQRQVRQYAAGLEKTVAERTAKLQDTVQELEAFSYSIAHDMRAPLRSMIGYAEIVRDEHAGGVDETGREYLRRITVSARRLDRLIQDVLNYSRIVREEMALESVDVRQLALEVIDSYPSLSALRECIAVDPELPLVMSNRAALTQVLSNLLENAVKFVPRSTVPKVRIQASPSAPPRDHERGEWVRVSVEDNGIGIEPSVRPRLFQMFQRFTRPGLYEGTGIGLAIARKAIERMGGLIGVDSVVGKGSSFWFVLRCAEPPDSTPSSP